MIIACYKHASKMQDFLWVTSELDMGQALHSLADHVDVGEIEQNSPSS